MSAPADQRADPERHLASTTRGCLSLGKTGSVALAAALRGAGLPEAVHLHVLGPRGLAFKRAHPDPMLDVALDLAGRVADPEHRFRFVTGVRDPIARILSYAFFAAMPDRSARGEAIVRDRDALIAWWDGQGEACLHDLWAEWFDDTYKATFGFDFRDHPFDHARKSLRFASERLRVVVLRQEDGRAAKEAELGWLLDREPVTLPYANTSSDQGYEASYQSFLASFVAPSHWLDACYESEVIRHCYTEAERDGFRFRWSGGRRSYAVDARLAVGSSGGDGEAQQT